KAIDKAAGAKRKKILSTGQLHKNRLMNDDGWSKIGAHAPLMDSRDAVTVEAKQWQGWGTALKPAWEPNILAMKPLSGTFVDNAMLHGVAGLNIDGGRIPLEDGINLDRQQRQQHSQGAIRGAFGAAALVGSSIPTYKANGRCPANVLLSHHPNCDDDG